MKLDRKKILILGAGQSAVHAASEIRKHDTDSIIKIFNQKIGIIRKFRQISFFSNFNQIIKGFFIFMKN